MEPLAKRIKPTNIDEGNNGKIPSALERNTDLFNKLIDSYEETFKDTLTPTILEQLVARAQKNFKNCGISYKQSSEFRKLLQNPKSLLPLQHLEAIFKKFKEHRKSSTSKCSNPKKDYEKPVENENVAISSEVYNKDLFQKFLDIIKERKLSQGSYADTETYMVRAWSLFNNCKSSYKKSTAFEDLLRKAIDMSAVDPGIQISTVIEELKYNKKVASKQQSAETKVSEPGCSTDAEQPGCSTSAAAEATLENAESDSDDDDLAGLELEDRKKVKKLEKILRLLNLRIKHLEERDVDFSKDDDEDSAYIKLDKYYRRFDQVYSKICQLKKQKADAGRVVKRKVTFAGGEIEKAVEKHYNKTNLFPDFHDVLKITKEVKKNEKLSPNALHAIAQKVFEEFGRLLQRRRKYDVYESACYYLTSHDPADEDPDLRARLEENYDKFKDSEKKIIDLYAEKSQGIELEEVGSNVEHEDVEKDETRNCDSDDSSSDPGKQESNVMNSDDETIIGDVKVQCDSDPKTKNKADFNPEKSCPSKNISSKIGESSDACTSKVTGKSSNASSAKCVKVSEKEPDSSIESKDNSGDEFKLKKSSDDGRSIRVSDISCPVSVEKHGLEQHGLTNAKEDKSLNLSNSSSSKVVLPENKNCESVNVEERKEKKDEKIKLSSSKSTNDCSIPVLGDCRSKNVDKDSCGLSSRKIDSENTVSNNGIITLCSSSKTAEPSNCDENFNKSESIKKKRKNSEEKSTEHKRPKKTEQILENSPTDDIEIIEVMHGSSSRTNKENVKKSNNSTDNGRIQKRVNNISSSTISDYFPRKVANTINSSDVNSRSNNVPSFNKHSAGSSHVRSNGNFRSSNASGASSRSSNISGASSRSSNASGASSRSSNVSGASNRSNHSSGTNSRSNHSSGANSRSNHSSGTDNLSLNHTYRHKTPTIVRTHSTFSNSSISNSSPIITAAYSLATPYDGNSSNSKPSASLPSGRSNQQKKDSTSWSQAVTKYRIPRASASSSSTSRSAVASSTPKPKDVIDLIDEGEDDSPDVSIVDEVRSNKPNPGNNEPMKMLLDRNTGTIKYISGEKTKEMLKHGNVKVFSRLKTGQPVNETKSDSVITLD